MRHGPTDHLLGLKLVVCLKLAGRALRPSRSATR